MLLRRGALLFFKVIVRFQGHTALKHVEFDLDWAFPDCNSSGYEMLHKAYISIEEVPYCFARSSVKFQGHAALKIVEFDPDWAFPDCNSTEFTNGYEMMHKAWSLVGEVPYCFSRSSVKFQGRTALKIVEFDPNWAFPDCNSSLNSPTATKWCTKLEVA